MNTVRKQINEIPLMSKERAEELKLMSDEDIDYSDIPPLNEDFLKKLNWCSVNQKRNKLASGLTQKFWNGLEITPQKKAIRL